MKQALGRRILTLFFCLSVLPVCAAEPAPQVSLAMHGAAKYAAGFDYFDYVNPDAPKGGTLKLGVVGSFDSLNPFIVRGTVPQAPAFGLFSSSSFYEHLMARSWDEPFTLYGLIAQTVQVPEDRSFIIFNLDPRARWQDGMPITAEDILFSYQTLRDQGRPNHRTYYKKVAHAQKLSTLRVRFDFTPNPDGSWDREMPLIMGLMPVLPAHYWQGKDFNQTTLTPPLSSGPYKIAKVDAGRSLTLTRDPDYWGRDLPSQKGMFNFDAVQLDFYRDDSIALQAFVAGTYDLRREMDPKKWAKAYDGLALKKGEIVLQAFPHRRTEAAYGFALNTRRSLLQNLALRRALVAAFDFSWINRTLFQGLYKRTQSYFPNSELADAENEMMQEEEKILRAHQDKGTLSSFNEKSDAASFRQVLLDAAAQLKQAGYVLRNEKLFTPQNEPVSFTIMLSDPMEEKVALEWARNLERLGIKAFVRTVDSAQYQARLNSFDYDVTTVRWYNSLSPGNEQIFYWGCTAAGQQGSRNYAGVCDPAVDALAKAIPAARTRDELIATTRALDHVLMAGAYFVPFYYLGAEQLALWKDKLAYPPQTPLLGPLIESWWGR